MCGIGWALSFVALCGCGFQVATNATSDAAPGGDAGGDGSSPLDAPPTDTPPPQHKLYAASQTTLYAIDVDTMVAARVGVIMMGATTFDVGGLAFDGTNLLGLSDSGSDLLVIDPATAQVTSRRAITPASTYYGLTVAPAGEAGSTTPVVFAGAMGSKLVRIDPATGAATTMGGYGAGLQFYTDLAWVSGAGLFMTMQAGACDPHCFARIDPATGTATTIRTDLTDDVYGLSGYRGTLWALDHAGPVRTVNKTTGAMTTMFDPAIPWTEAAQ